MPIVKRILVFLKPTGLTLLFFVLALRLVPSTWHEVISPGSENGPDAAWVDYGGALQLRYDPAGKYSDYSIEPLTMLKTLLALFAIALLLSKWVKRAKWMKWWAIAALAPIAIGLASIVTKQMWGFYFFRPGVSGFASQFASIDAVSGITTGGHDVKPVTFLPDPSLSIEDELKERESDEYYFLSGRILLALNERGLLPKTTATIEGLAELFRAVQRSGELVPADERYGPYDQLSGLAVQGQSATGEKLLFVGVGSPQLSNDHYAWYELLFVSGADQQLRLIRAQHFFYDVAGLEYVTFDSIALGFVCTAYLFVLPGLVLLGESVRLLRMLFRKTKTEVAV